MHRHSFRAAVWLPVALVLAVGAVVLGAAPQTVLPKYFPPRGEWQKREPANTGFDKAKLDEAIAFAIANENPNTKDLALDIPDTFKSEAPYNTVDGPTQPRAAANGIVIRHGFVVAEWGDTARTDMTFSVTKTFLSTVVGLAVADGKIKNVKDPVGAYMPQGVDLFLSPHNASITWDHLLRQTSDWSGTLFGQADWADRPPRGQKPEQWVNREMHEPGTFYKYNDVRVNVLSLATLFVVKRPLPEVLKERVMDPIGASNSWHWEPYEKAYVTIDGKRMPSVPGGGHHGGGMFINAWDLARFGYLFLNNGRWSGKQIVPESWSAMAKTPGTANPNYGFMNWFLNTPDPKTGRGPLPATPATSVTFQGNGQNIVYLDWDHDLVVVVRWIRNGTALNDFLGRVVAAVVK
jgi:CubicO group peptidase (beta-lactamase class C family)